MKISMPLAAILATTTPRVVNAVCNVDEHHPGNNGYHVEGINGYIRDADGNRVDDPSSGVNFTIFLSDATWAVGEEYPDGSLEFCTGQFCSDVCRDQGCAVQLPGTTCSEIRFCYDEDSGSDVWKLPSEVALANCDFSEATEVCNTTEGAGDNCCNYVTEEDAILGPRFFASKEGCAEGQKVAVKIDDYDESGDQCYAMGLGSSRISKCTCGEVTSLVEPCHSEFIQGCLFHTQDGASEDDACCATETCVGKHQDFSDPIGQTVEAARQLSCNDNIPGACMVGDDTDCCSKTCTQCGIELDPFARWGACTAGNSTAFTADCGSFSSHVCDFTECEIEDNWHYQQDILQSYLEVVDPTSSAGDAYCAPGECGTGGCYDMDGSLGGTAHDCVCLQNTCSSELCAASGGTWTDGCSKFCNPDACDAQGAVTFLDAAATSGNYATLLELVTGTAGVMDAITANVPVTVFGPTDAAFAKIAGLADLTEAEVFAILAGHVVGSEFRAADVIAAGCVEVETLAESIMLKVAYTEGVGVTVNDILVVDADIGDENSIGVLHGVDTVISLGTFTPCEDKQDPPAPSSDPSTNAPTAKPDMATTSAAFGVFKVSSGAIVLVLAALSMTFLS